jgi:hypothetical protein
MNEALIVELWDLLKEYGDKKQMSIIAERFVELIGEYGATEQNLEDVLGHDDALDEALREFLDIEDDHSEEDYDYDDE